MSSIVVCPRCGRANEYCGEPATKREFLLIMLPFLPATPAAAVVAYGLWQEHVWARPLLLGFYLVSGLASVLLPFWSGAASAPVLPGLVFSVALVGLLSWYLYRKRNVVRYYEILAAPTPVQRNPHVPPRPTRG